MTGIDDLRATLTHRADEAVAVATDTVTRTAAVHGRVATVRRRRRAGAAAGVAAVLAVVGGVALLPSGSDGPDPATPTVAGLEAPRSLESLGWTYDFADAVEGEGRVRVDLPSSDRPRVVTWATAGEEQGVWVRSGGQDLRVTEADFTGLVPLAPGEPARVVLDGVGRLGLAVYELGDDVPAGVTEHGVTFRKRVADRTLVTAAVGAPGESTVALEAQPPTGTTGLAVLCAGPAGGRVDITFDGRPGYGLGCGDDTSGFDPGARLAVTGLPRSFNSIEVTAVDAEGRPLERAVQVGLGLYSIPDGGQRLLGEPLPQLVEAEGRTWELERYTALRPGDRTWQASPTQAVPRLVRVVSRGPIELTANLSGQPPQSVGVEVPGPVTTGVGVADSFDSVQLRWRPRGDGEARVAVVLYRPLEEPGTGSDG